MLAWIEMVAKSICGNGDTGNWRNASKPANAMPIVNRIVATGRLMNSAENPAFMASPSR